jgi:hypothetical protein
VESHVTVSAFEVDAPDEGVLGEHVVAAVDDIERHV